MDQSSDPRKFIPAIEKGSLIKIQYLLSTLEDSQLSPMDTDRGSTAPSSVKIIQRRPCL